MSKSVRISSAAEFTRHLSSSRVVVADFYADWCGPCKAIAPFYETLAAKYSKPSAVTFTKINTDEQRQITQTYSISAMPTFLIFKGGKEVKRIQGADPKSLEAAVKSAIADVSLSSFEGSGRKLGDAVPAAASAPAAGAGAGAGRTAGGKPMYMRDGQAMSSIPFAVQLQRFLDAAYVFLALYFVSFFSFNPYEAAEASSFNQKKRRPGERPGWGGYGRGGGGPGGGPGGPGGPGGRGTFGKLNARGMDVNGPMCGSCG